LVPYLLICTCIPKPHLDDKIETTMTTASSRAAAIPDPREPSGSPPATVNPDLARERSSLPFDPLAITNFLDGGSDATARRRKLEGWIIRDPTGIFSNEDNNYLHRTERHARSLAKFVRLVELCRSAGIGSPTPADADDADADAADGARTADAGGGGASSRGT
jgi:hypothetical protein